MTKKLRHQAEREQLAGTGTAGECPEKPPVQSNRLASDFPTSTVEGTKADRRSPNRHKVLKVGTIVSANGNVLDCTVRNLSRFGATLDVTGSVGVPDEFVLSIPGDALRCRHGRVISREAGRIGVAFSFPLSFKRKPNALDNYLLSTLPAGDLAQLTRHFRTVELQAGQILAQPGDEIRNIYFPHSGIISFMVETADGHVVQTSMVGRDGVVGSAQAVDSKVSLNRIVVQIPAVASVIDRAPLRECLGTGSAVRNLLAAHEQFFVADIQQTAVCNALHTVEARMCRWLLRMMDLSKTKMNLTQDQLAAMIGARRRSVSDAASNFQSNGLITYSRGAVRIKDAEGLKQSACECYESVRQNYKRIFSIPLPEAL